MAPAPETGEHVRVTLTPASAHIEDYLAADAVIDHEHPAVRALARRLRAADPDATARAAFAFVRDRIEHSFDVDAWSAAYRASDVLAAGNSLCHGQAHLLTALLRASGIPAGITYQKLSALHALVAVRRPAGWVRIDPRDRRGRYAATPETERLVYPDAPSSAIVYPAPPADLARCLARARPGVAGYRYLPVELP
jgi:transglutaminase-like putative cysteine protease